LGELKLKQDLETSKGCVKAEPELLSQEQTIAANQSFILIFSTDISGLNFRHQRAYWSLIFKPIAAA
jgi:hypothetical protein